MNEPNREMRNMNYDDELSQYDWNITQKANPIPMKSPRRGAPRATRVFETDRWQCRMRQVDGWPGATAAPIVRAKLVVRLVRFSEPASTKNMRRKEVKVAERSQLAGRCNVS